MSVDSRSSQDTNSVHENPEQMFEDLQNSMSMAPSEYSQPPATPANSSPPMPYNAQDTMEYDPESPPPSSTRPDTANSMDTDRTRILKKVYIRSRSRTTLIWPELVKEKNKRSKYLQWIFLTRMEDVPVQY